MTDVQPCPEPLCPGTLGPDQICRTCGRSAEGDEGVDDRFPCPDGECIGIVGLDGRCTECRTQVSLSDPYRNVSVEDRLPCPDGECIGIIGPDGRCSECGSTGDATPTGHDPKLGAATDELDEPNEGDEDRVPCPDGTCIGIIGPDGRCTECGQREHETS